MVMTRISIALRKLWRSNRVLAGSQHGIPVSIARNGNLMLKRKKFENKGSEAPTSPKNFSEFKKKPKRSIFDPRGMFAQKWNMLFFMASIISLFVDPVFFLLPEVRPELCIQLGGTIKVVLTILRSGVDLFYIINILVQFRMAYVSPLSRVIGRGELVTDPWKIATKYLRFSFWNDITAALPLPQISIQVRLHVIHRHYFCRTNFYGDLPYTVVGFLIFLFVVISALMKVFVWVILPSLKGSTTSRFKTYLLFFLTIQMLQLLHRCIIAYPLSLQLCKASGIITEKSWVGAAYTLMFYMFASIVSGNCWYMLSMQRQKECWDMVCNQESSTCVDKYFDCSNLRDPSRSAWFQSSNITNFCNPGNNLYPYGIYSFTVTVNISTGGFFNKYFYCLWWGLRNLSSQGQNLATSLDISENIFSYMVATLGLILFGFIVATMQKYLDSPNVRLEKWRLKQTDLTQWMHHRQLPKELRQSIHEYYTYKWVATQGVDEEAIHDALPLYLRRQTKQYLCLNLVRQVPLFDQLDDQTLNTICERLQPKLYTRSMYIVSEGEPVKEMLFIMRGHLFSYTTDGGRCGFFNSSKLGPNGFCGEEILAWVLDKHRREVLPTSTRTVKAITNVEGFILKADDLKFITKQFRRMHSRELRDKLRFYSQQWRTWAACFIQAAWHRCRRWMIRSNVARVGENLEHQDEQQQSWLSTFPCTGYEDMNIFVPRPDAGIEIYAARLLAVKRSASNRFG